jgi:outer membrane protein TolC
MKPYPSTPDGKPLIWACGALTLCLLLSIPARGQVEAHPAADTGSPTEVQASPAEGSTPASLEDQFLEAADHHPGVQAAREHWVAAASAVAQEKGWPDPVLSYGYYIVPVQTAVGPQRQRLSLSQRIPWFGKLSARGSAAEQAALAAEQDYLAAQLALFERVADAHYEHAYLGEAIRVTRENLHLLTNQEEVARIRYSTQSASYSELVKAQVELGLLEDRLRTLEDRHDAAAARLRETLGQDPTVTTEMTSSLDPPRFVVPEREEVQEKLERQNPKLLSLDHQITGAGARAEAVHKEGMPDFTLGIQTIFTSPSDLTSFQGQGEDAWIATVAMNIPLWRGKYSGAENAELAKQRELQFRYRERRLDLLARSEELLYELRDAERKIDLYDAGLLPKARQAVEASSTAFQTGSAGFLDFIDAQRTLLQFQLELARARADYGERVMALVRLMGEAPVEIPYPHPEEGSKP